MDASKSYDPYVRGSLKLALISSDDHKRGSGSQVRSVPISPRLTRDPGLVVVSELLHEL